MHCIHIFYGRLKQISQILFQIGRKFRLDHLPVDSGSVAESRLITSGNRVGLMVPDQIGKPNSTKIIGEVTDVIDGD